VCQTQNLSIRQNPLGVGMGQFDYDFILTNKSPHICALSGYPAAAALDKTGQVAKQIQFRHLPAMAPEPYNLRIRVLRLKPGAHAWFQVTSRDGTGMEDLSLCGTAKQIEFIPPGNNRSFQKRFQFYTCTDSPGITFILPGLP
jgi:uncharacterized protein DUF4232